MKKSLLFITLFILAINSFGQSFELTPVGFVCKADPSKNYIVVDVPNAPKNKLYMAIKKYVNNMYNNPKFVSSDIENEQLVIDAVDNTDMRVTFRLNGSNLWHLNYKYVIDFKDNKIKFTPYFKYLGNYDDAQIIELIGVSALGNSTGLFNKKGKILREKGISLIEESVNSYFEALKNYLSNPKETQNENW